MTRLLWRLAAPPELPTDLAGLADGVRLHIAHSPLTTIAMRAGTLQRCYLALESCAGCARGLCRIGCPAALFSRMLLARLPGSSLELLAHPQGLVSRPYRQVVLAWPSASAAPFDAAALDAWDEARLIVHWRRGDPCSAAALLAVGAGPDPLAFAGARGWQALALPRWIGARVAGAALPAALWPLRRYPAAPFVLIA